MTVQILEGDCREQLRNLPGRSVHCCVTSPPYFGLRDYGMAAQIGLEPTPDQYVSEMVSLFRDVHRVLRDDGTLWLNLGDSYAGADSGKFRPGNPDKNGGNSNRNGAARIDGIAPKQRLMIPARVALALQADGWWLRDEIVWHKPNPMPVSVTDRTTPAHEMLYMFSKNGSNPVIWRAHDTGEWSNGPDKSQRVSAPTDADPANTEPRWRGHDYFYDMEAVKEPIAESSKKRYAQPKAISGEQAGGEKQDAYEAAGITSGSRRPNEIVSALAKQHKQDLAGNRQYTGSNDRFFNSDKQPETLRQPRSVWSIPTKPFKGAHFATFPENLVRPCILAGCPVGGTVLDPFFGAGTTGLVASRLGRNAIGIELNPAYATIARERISADAPLFADNDNSPASEAAA